MRPLLAKIGAWFGRALLAVLPPVVALGLCAAAVWNTVHGERGTLAQETKRQEIAAAQARLEQLTAERLALENKVNSLRGDTLDLDLLDERARRMLNQFGKDELVVPYEPAQRLQ
jgi:cell division protein FtsB